MNYDLCRIDGMANMSKEIKRVQRAVIRPATPSLESGGCPVGALNLFMNYDLDTEDNNGAPLIALRYARKEIGTCERHSRCLTASRELKSLGHL